ncbi:hypothetical protein L7F22_027506 [Adiantum nelumboides]|nr:hypothetical protein [Adiantum nelumboides]
MRMPNVTTEHDDVDGHLSGSEHSLDEELSIPSIRTQGVRRLHVEKKASGSNEKPHRFGRNEYQVDRLTYDGYVEEHFAFMAKHPSASRITIRLALELAGKPYDLRASSNASRLTIRLADECSRGPRYVFNALDSNASRITKRLADGCSEGPRCVFNVLNCVKLQRGPFEHASASRITIRIVLELVGKPYDLPASSNASRLTIRLTDGCSKGPLCVFSALDCVKLQHESFEHPSASRITIRLTLELAGKPYDLPTSSTASRLTIRLADGCSKGPRCVFSALDGVKLQRGPFEHPSASRITIRLALELAGKSYDLLVNRITIRLALELVGKPFDLPASSNASRITKRLADGCSKGPRCTFSDLNCVKLQRGSFKHPLTNRIIIRLALELAGKPYDLPASSNASQLTIRLADKCLEDPRCVFSALNYVKLQHGPSEHPSASRITIRFTLEFAGKPYDLPASSNAIRLTIRLADGCSEGPRCVFSALDCVKLQRGPSEHPSASHNIIRFALELAGKPYDLSASSNARRITIRFADGCSEGPCCAFSALECIKLQREPSKHTSASRITILVGKPYDLPKSSNSSQLTIRLADGCSDGPCCVFNALDCVKLQRGSFEHPSASRITILLALELIGKFYSLSASSNATRITKRLADGCSEGPRCVFSALDCVKLQRGSFEHPSASRIIIRLALELVAKPYDLLARSITSRLTIQLTYGYSEGPRCVLSALDWIKLQRGPFEHPSASRITIRLPLELAGKPYDLPASSNASRLTIRLGDECSKDLRCVFSALSYVKSQRGPS